MLIADTSSLGLMIYLQVRVRPKNVKMGDNRTLYNNDVIML